MLIARSASLILLTLGVSGCTLPRNAALRSEITALQATPAPSSTSEGEGEGERRAPPPSPFQLLDVTQENLPQILSWSEVGPEPKAWIAADGAGAPIVIAAGDRVKLTVWDAEENSLLTEASQRFRVLQEMNVATSGNVFLPYLGVLPLAGLPPDQARDEVQEAYSAMIPSAQVQLTLLPGPSHHAHMVAGVKAPGPYAITDPDDTLLALLAMGGGVDPRLVNPQVELFRDETSYSIALSKLYDAPELDPPLRGGDRVIVREEARAFYAMGATKTQARYIFPKEDLTALEALALLGGVEEEAADPKSVLIMRQYRREDLGPDDPSGPEQDRVIFVMDLTSADGLFSAQSFPIMADDLLYATESPVTRSTTIIGLLRRLFGLGLRAERL